MTDDERDVPAEQRRLRQLVVAALADDEAEKDAVRHLLRISAENADAVAGRYIAKLAQMLELLVDDDIDESRRRVARALNGAARIIFVLATLATEHRLDSATDEPATVTTILETVAESEGLGWWFDIPGGEQS